MKLNKIITFAFIVSIALSSCMKVPSELKQGFKYCYDGKNTGLDTVINLHGYYSMGRPVDHYGLNGEREHKIDTFDINFMFFPDGVFLYNFSTYYRKESIPEYFNRVVETTKKGKIDYFYKSQRWGRYIVSGDTIKAQWFNLPASLNDNWYGGEVWFKIISQNELREIDLPWKVEKEFRIGNEVIKQFKTLPARFIPVDIVPSSNTKLKEKEWFWCESAKVK